MVYVFNDYMRYFLLILFLFLFFPKASFANAKYEGKEPLMDNKYSKGAGNNNAWPTLSIMVLAIVNGHL